MIEQSLEKEGDMAMEDNEILEPQDLETFEEEPKEPAEDSGAEQTGEAEAKPPKKKWKRVMTVISVVLLSLLGLLIVVILVGALWVNHLLNQIDYKVEDDVTLSSSEAEQIIMDDPEMTPVDDDEDIPDLEDLTFPDELPVEPDSGNQPTGSQTGDQQGSDPAQPPATTINRDPGPAVNQDNVINIMLVGQDRRPGQGRQRSDSMILVTFNKSKGTITLTSFMRDAYVRIPGYKPNKLNATYAFGGMKLLNQTLEQNFGVQVDGNLEVDFNNFEKLIDLLGGVNISLTKAEADYLNKTYKWYGTRWEVHKGSQTLDGEQALAYSRIRKLDSDYRRAERQRKVISSLIQKYKSKSVTEMMSLLEKILPLVTTNMTKGQIVDYLWELVPMLPGASINTLRIPADGTFRQGNVRVRKGLAAWFQYDIDFYANRRLLNKVFAQ